MPELPRRLAAECLGTAMLLAAVVGSGIMAEKLTDDTALALLCNALATGAVLFVIITMFLPVSGAHFNPAVTAVAVLEGDMRFAPATLYVVAQIGGALIGVVVAHAMFGMSVVAWGINARDGFAQALSEAVATFGLILTIGGMRSRDGVTIAASVALYIVAAYWFTASTSFANPAVTLARGLTPTFSGIAPADVPAFVAAQLVGASLAWFTWRKLFLHARGKVE
jgi:glycerol uptake facilitator-like aquaporin